MNAEIESAAFATDAQETSAPALDPAIVHPGEPHAWRRFSMRIAALSIAALAAGGYWQTRRGGGLEPVYVTEPVVRGDLRISVSANGTLQPTRVVNIGSELSGTVTRVVVDVNDPVKKGQVLAELDTSKFRDQVERSRASLASATAKVAQTVATVRESQASLARLREVARLSDGKVPSKAELSAAEAGFERARADEAAARAGVADASAALSTDTTNLSKATIRSPIDGVVLTRAVDPGNAVAAALQAVTLFTIAEDLSKMKLQVDVDEADVGRVGAGQSANFSVSAYPARKYSANVTRVAYGSTVTNSVVTYVTHLNVQNRDLSLRPGMTATASIGATERRNVLLVPSTALRFTPLSIDTVPDAAGAPKRGGLMSSLMPGPPGGGLPARAPKTAVSGATGRQVWILRDGQLPVSIAIESGISDGRMTEVTSAALQPGMQVITDQRSATP